MLSTVRSSRPLFVHTARRLSSETTTPAASSPIASTGGTAGLFQRLSSFLIGAGLTALVTQYFIFEEVKAGNQLMLKKQADLESRVSKLEKK